jgi:oxalate decarboxylase
LNELEEQKKQRQKDKTKKTMHTNQIYTPTGPTSALPPQAYHLNLAQVPKVGWKKSGVVQVVTGTSFPVLNNQGVTSFVLEIFDQSMRIMHWHSQAEVGYVERGEINVVLWLSPTESSVFRVPRGTLYLIPAGALHALEQVGNTHAHLLIGFASSSPTDFDLPVAYNALPPSLRTAYTGSQHSSLSHYASVPFDPLTGFLPPQQNTLDKKSPYFFNLQKNPPLFENKTLGKVTWAIADNWTALQDTGISFVQTILQPNVVRDAIWWPNASVLYVVSRGQASFRLVFPGWEATDMLVKEHDMIFVPVGTMHTILNRGSTELNVIGFFNTSSPLPEVSLGAATNFFPKSVGNASLSSWGNSRTLHSFPLRDLKNFQKSPYMFGTQGQKVKQEPSSIMQFVQKGTAPAPVIDGPSKLQEFWKTTTGCCI